MNIVILDGRAMNPGDLSWDGIRRSGKLTVYAKTEVKDIIDRAKDAHIILTNKTLIDGDTIKHLTKCRYIGVLASGYNVVDIDAAKKHGIVVTNVPNYSTVTVSQHVFAFILDIITKVGLHDQHIKQNKWATSDDFTYYEPPISELYQKKIGIVGFGNIGKSVAKIANAFEMEVLIYDKGKEEVHPLGQKVSLDTIFKVADFITLHLPLKEQTRHIIDRDSFDAMRPEAVLINTARAQLVDKEALLDALDLGKISWYATDVMEQEPPQIDDPLIKHPKTKITGHMAWASLEARARCIDIATKNIQAFLGGNPIHQVNK